MATINTTDPKPGFVYDLDTDTWYPLAGIAAQSLDGLTDVIITSPATNQSLIYDGTNWVNSTEVGDITAVTSGTGITVTNGTGPIPTITNSMATEISAKGDLIVGTGSQTFDNLTAGSNGDTIVVDSSTSTGLRYQPTMAAGKNICINGGFDIWQRGTSFTTFVYTADRWKMNPGGTVTVSQDTDVPTGVGVRYSLKQTTSASSSYSQYQMGFEQATTIPMRNQVYTFSFYMKANATWSGAFSPQIYYSNSSDTLSTIMSGTLVTATGNTAPTPTTSWVRYSVTFTVPSDAVGIGVYFAPAAVQASGAELWIAGCQWEIGSVATAFTRSGGTIQGETSACQRYYQKSYNTTTAPATATSDGILAYFNATSVANNSPYASTTLRTTMRATPTITCYSQNGTAAVASKVSDGLDLASNTAVASQIGANAFLVRNQNASTFTTTQGATFQWIAEAEL